MPGLVQVASSICCFCEEHLGGGFEALVLEEALDEFAARVFGFAAGDVAGVAGEKCLRFDVDQERGHVDELAGGVDIGLLQVLGVFEELAGDAGDGNVVDVDVLLADEVEEEIEGAVVDLPTITEKGKTDSSAFLLRLGGGAAADDASRAGSVGES